MQQSVFVNTCIQNTKCNAWAASKNSTSAECIQAQAVLDVVVVVVRHIFYDSPHYYVRTSKDVLERLVNCCAREYKYKTSLQHRRHKQPPTKMEIRSHSENERKVANQTQNIIHGGIVKIRTTGEYSTSKHGVTHRMYLFVYVPVHSRRLVVHNSGS